MDNGIWVNNNYDRQNTVREIFNKWENTNNLEEKSIFKEKWKFLNVPVSLEELYESKFINDIGSNKYQNFLRAETNTLVPDTVGIEQTKPTHMKDEPYLCLPKERPCKASYVTGCTLVVGKDLDGNRLMYHRYPSGGHVGDTRIVDYEFELHGPKSQTTWLYSIQLIPEINYRERYGCEDIVIFPWKTLNDEYVTLHFDSYNYKKFYILTFRRP